MTLTEIRQWISEIHDMADDDERAHGHEDALRDAFIQSIADGTCKDPVACAKLVLTTGDIRFARWCA